MKKSFLFCLFANLASLYILAQPNLKLEVYASGFTRPVDISSAGDERLFITEQSGKIKIIDGDGNVLPTPFLNISGRVNDSFNEQGLLGLAFHPNYQINGYFYVNYTDLSGGDTRIARFKVSADNPNIADPNSEVILLEIDQPFSNHNAGDLNFGPDGFLYFGTGDGGSGGDPGNRAQNTQVLLGKMMRFDVGENGDLFQIPPSNPFVGNNAVRDEIWAIGTRNPWRFSFDRETGDLWIGDVGQNEWEEIDFQPAASSGGENYGWRCYEGTHTFDLGGCPPMNELTPPVFDYSHSLGCSVTGGFVYRGCTYPELYGRYIFADFCSGRFWSITPNGSGGWTTVQLGNLSDNQYSSFGEDSRGELYVAALQAGSINRVTETTATFTIDIQKTDLSCPADTNGSISISWSSGNDPVSVLWENGLMEAQRTNLSEGNYTATITGGNGCQRIENIRIEALQAAEKPEITLNGPDQLAATAGFAAYQWLLEGTPVAGAVNQTLQPGESGNYTVVVVNDSGCTAVSESFFFEVLAVGEINGLRRFVLRPNPFNQLLHLEMEAERKIELILRILNIQGQTVFEEPALLNGKLVKTIELANLASGLYFFSVKSEQGSLVQQIVKN